MEIWNHSIVTAVASGDSAVGDTQRRMESTGWRTSGAVESFAGDVPQHPLVIETTQTIWMLNWECGGPRKCRMVLHSHP